MTRRLEPRLGLATTEELIRELISRFSHTFPHDDIGNARNTARALMLAEMMGGMNAVEREYRTVDS